MHTLASLQEYIKVQVDHVQFCGGYSRKRGVRASTFTAVAPHLPTPQAIYKPDRTLKIE